MIVQLNGFSAVNSGPPAELNSGPLPLGYYANQLTPVAIGVGLLYAYSKGYKKIALVGLGIGAYALFVAASMAGVKY